jgi:outer membrane protein assembly factor BamB
VFVGTDAARLHAVSALDGDRIWSIDVGGPVRRSPAIADGVAFVAADGGIVTAVDLANGKVRWRRGLGAGEVSTPAVADGMAVLARGPFDLSAPHEIVALDAATGDTIGAWPSPTVDRMFLGALVDGVAWAVGEDGAVRSVDLNASGAALEQRFAASSPIGSLASVVDHTIYITTTGGTIHALDRATAEVLWESQLEGSLTTPVVIDGRIIVGTALGEAVVLADAPAGTDQE